MPVTTYQKSLLRLLAVNRSEDSHLAGGAALHFAPNSKRFSNDLDYFHDSEQRVAGAFAADQSILLQHGHKLQIEVNQPGYIRATVSKDVDITKVEWAYDSAWRFLPVLQHPEIGFVLHPLDLAINKVLALAGREEPRDLIDVLDAHERILPLGGLVWAAPGKDPGFNPSSLISMLRRRSKYRSEDFARLMLLQPVDVVELKERWLFMLEQVTQAVLVPPPNEIGCLYVASGTPVFEWPHHRALVAHYPTRGGVWPQVRDAN